MDGLLKAPWRGGPLRSPWRLPGDPREQDVSRLECCLPAPSPGHGVASPAFRRPGPCQMERRCHLRPLLVPTGTSAVSECRWSALRTPARTVSDFAGSVLSCVGPVGARWRVQHRPGPAGGTVDGAAAARLVVPQAASGSWNGGTTGGAEPPSSRREPRRGRSRVGGAPAHTQVRRASCFVSAAAALACGLQPQDGGTAVFSPSRQVPQCAAFPQLAGSVVSLGEESLLGLMLTCEALWKVLERARCLWMRNADSQGTRDCDCVSVCVCDITLLDAQCRGG